MAAFWAIFKTVQAAITFKRASFQTCYGTEFISRELDFWTYANAVTLDFSRPGKPTDRAIVRH